MVNTLPSLTFRLRDINRRLSSISASITSFDIVVYRFTSSAMLTQKLSYFPLDEWEVKKNNIYKGMSNPPLVAGQFYHIYNRGVEKRNVFVDRWDYLRFLETVDFYRKSPLPVKLSDYRRGKKGLKKTEKQVNLVRIYCYCLMPNHFHLLLEQMEDKGISIFLRKLSNSYTRFFNTKHERIGPLFQGSFKAKIIESDENLLQLSKYIHRNSFPLSKWEVDLYPYSSYPYYVKDEEHEFCNTKFILGYFSKNNTNLTYKSFVEESDIEDPGVYSMFIDNDY